MYTGNAVIVNLAMRFPMLVPLAAAVGIALVIPPAPPVAQPPIAVVTPQLERIVPPVKRVVPPIETLCPPQELLTKAEVAKLTTSQRNQLKSKGCIKG